MLNPRRRIMIAAAGIAACVGLGLAAWMYAHPTPKRFAEVVPGRLYRCGDISPHELEYVVGTTGIKTVLSLLNPEVQESIAEKAAAIRLGLRWENVPLPGDGASTPEDRERIKQVLFDPAAAPLLVHCSAGTNRTGLTIGMYRIYEDGWTVDQVLEEMRRFDFEDLPKHENLRAALRTEWAIAQSNRATEQWKPSSP